MAQEIINRYLLILLFDLVVGNWQDAENLMRLLVPEEHDTILNSVRVKPSCAVPLQRWWCSSLLQTADISS